MLRKTPSRGPRQHQLHCFNRLLLSSDRHLLSSDRHHFDYVTNHSVFTITVLVLLYYRSFMPIRRPHEYRTVMIVCFDRHPN